MTKCKYCGIDQSQSIQVTARLGADEPDVEFKCTCLQTIKIIRNYTENDLPTIGKVRTFSTTKTSQQDYRQNFYSTTKNTPREKEVEITFSNKLSHSLLNITEGGLNKENILRELGMPVLVKFKGVVRNALWRQRVYTNKLGVSRSENVWKLSHESHWLLPGINLSFCTELSAPKLSTSVYEESACFGYYHLPTGIDVTDKCLKDNELVKRGDIVRILKYKSSNRYSAEVEFRYVPKLIYDQPAISGMLRTLFTRLDSLRSWKHTMDSTYLSNLRESATPVIDAMVGFDETFVYTLKADGQMTWIFDYGGIYIVTSHNTSLKVLAVCILRTCPGSILPLSVHRCELIPSGRLVYIDTLMKEGKQVPISRKIQRPCERILQDLDLLVRDYFELETDAASYKEEMSEEVPSDGILAVNTLNSQTYRIKEPTIDLMYFNGYLYVYSEPFKDRDYDELRKSGNEYKLTKFKSFEGLLRHNLLLFRGRRYLPVCSFDTKLKDSIVYEFGLVVNETGSSFDFVSWHERTDKELPNASYVLDHLSLVHLTGNCRDEVARRTITDVCFKMREKVVNTAMDSRTKGKLIIDAGSGVGQSLMIFKATDASVLFCDPKFKLKNRYKHYKKEIQDLTGYSEESVERWIFSSNFKSGRYAVYRKSIEVLMKILGCCMISQLRIPITFMFSLSQMRRFMPKLVNDLPNPIIACEYLYDNIDSQGILVNKFGIDMRIISREDNEEDGFESMKGMITNAQISVDNVTKYLIDSFNNFILAKCGVSFPPSVSAIEYPITSDLIALLGGTILDYPELEHLVSQLPEDVNDVVKHIKVFQL